MGGMGSRLSGLGAHSSADTTYAADSREPARRPIHPVRLRDDDVVAATGAPDEAVEALGLAGLAADHVLEHELVGPGPAVLVDALAGEGSRSASRRPCTVWRTSRMLYE